MALLLTVSSIAASADGAGEPLVNHRWQHRILLLFAPGDEAAAIDRFERRLAQYRCGIDARDLVTGRVIGDRTGRLADDTLTPRDVRLLRERLGIATDRLVTVLIGKDGGEKMTVDGVAAMDAVFERIDGMPMRQREMREREDPGCP